MKTQFELVFLGAREQTSKKSGNQYMLATFQNAQNDDIFEFYVSGDKLKLITAIAELTKYSTCAVTIAITSFNNKPKVDLEAVEG